MGELPTEPELAYSQGMGGTRRKRDTSESSVYSLLTSWSPMLNQCRSMKENSAAIPVGLGRDFSSLMQMEVVVSVRKGLGCIIPVFLPTGK